MKFNFSILFILQIISSFTLHGQTLCKKDFPKQGFTISSPCNINMIANTDDLLDFSAENGRSADDYFAMHTIYRKMKTPEDKNVILNALKDVIKDDQFFKYEANLTPVFESEKHMPLNANPYEAYHCKAYTKKSQEHYKRYVEGFLFVGKDCNIMVICYYFENYKGPYSKKDIFGSVEWLPQEVRNTNLGLSYKLPPYATIEKARADNNGTEIRFTKRNKKSTLEIFKVKTSEKEFIASQTNNKGNYKFDNGMTLGPDSRFTEYNSYRTKNEDIEYLVKYYLFKNNGQLYCARVSMESSPLGIIATDVEKTTMPILQSIH